jgi:hypothetical protein
MTFVLIGFALVRTLIPGPPRFCRHDWFRLILGAGIGSGVVSCCLFLSLATGIPLEFLENTLLAVGAIAAFTRCRTAKCTFCCTTAPTGPRRVTAAVGVLFVVVLFCTMGVFLLVSVQSPHGAWDAWAIHNLRARFLFRGETHWTDVLSPELDFSHPDYPLLLPGFVAREWKAIGSEAIGVPAAVAFLFTFGTVGVLTASIYLLRGRMQGLLAGAVLLGTPYFVIDLGPAQMADVPLAYFLVTTLALLALYEHRPQSPGLPVLAGTSVALAGWTKNEGLLLLVSVALAYSVAVAILRRWSNWRMMAGFALGAAPVLAVVLYFKLVFAPANYVLTQQSLGPDNILALWRYRKVAETFALHLWRFGGLALSPLLFVVAYLFIVRLRPAKQIPLYVPAGALSVLFAGAGYFVMFVSTAAWLLDELINTTLDRLLLHLWPAAILVAFSAARAPLVDGRESKPNDTVPALVAS